MSFEQLDLWLQTVESAPPVASLSMVDGYVTAVVVGPCSIPPDEWFAKLPGEHGRIATAAGDTMAPLLLKCMSVLYPDWKQRRVTVQRRLVGDGSILPMTFCVGALHSTTNVSPQARESALMTRFKSIIFPLLDQFGDVDIFGSSVRNR